MAKANVVAPWNETADCFLCEGLGGGKDIEELYKECLSDCDKKFQPDIKGETSPVVIEARRKQKESCIIACNTKYS
jgi:hypothetical protein